MISTRGPTQIPLGRPPPEEIACEHFAFRQSTRGLVSSMGVRDSCVMRESAEEELEVEKGHLTRE